MALKEAGIADWRPDFEPSHLYFVTTTAAHHQNLFNRDVVKRLVAESLDCMGLRGRFKVYGFVIMPNDLHMMIQCTANDLLA